MCLSFLLLIRCEVCFCWKQAVNKVVGFDLFINFPNTSVMIKCTKMVSHAQYLISLRQYLLVVVLVITWECLPKNGIENTNFYGLRFQFICWGFFSSIVR